MLTTTARSPARSAATDACLDGGSRLHRLRRLRAVHCGRLRSRLGGDRGRRARSLGTAAVRTACPVGRSRADRRVDPIATRGTEAGQPPTHTHRRIGWIYLWGAWITSLSSLGVAAFFDVSVAARIVFAAGSLLWFGTTTVAFVRIRRARVLAHREWMIRSFSLAFFFVTGSLWMPLLAGTALPEAIGYPLAVFLSWSLNLVAAELWVRRTRPQPSSMSMVTGPPILPCHEPARPPSLRGGRARFTSSTTLSPSAWAAGRPRDWGCPALDHGMRLATPGGRKRAPVTRSDTPVRSR